MAGQVHRAPHRRPKDTTTGPEVVAGWGIRGREVVEDRGRHRAGAVASPLLANIYLHYVFDLWVRHWRNIMLPAILLSSAMPMTSSWDSKIGRKRSGFSANGRTVCKSSDWSCIRTRRA